MIKAKGIKIISIGVILIVIQSFLQQYDTFHELYSKYIGYLVPVIHAFFITIFLEPIVSIIEKKFKMKRVVAVIVTILLVFSLIGIFIAIIAPQVIESIKDLYGKLPVMQVQLEKYTSELIEFLKSKGLLLLGDTEIKTSITNFIKENMRYFQNFGISVLWNIMWWGIALTKFVIGFFLAFLILIDKEYFIKFISNIMSLIFTKEKAKGIMGFLGESREILLKFVWGRIIVSIAVGIITFLVMFVTGTPYALLSGMMIGMGNMIPYVGSIVAGSIAILLVGLAEPFKLIFLGIAILVAQAVDGWVIGPKIVSETVGMRIFWVVVSILIGGSLFGPVGMFFGVPVFGMIKLIYTKILNKKEELITDDK
ncbi:AI-2E family transporter [Fusobacterium mortiferum]|uniref:AI-2E family transporter n=1 Tax=Fusobacterium mortiferum TaxID=850 RepID=UPI001958156D|nr:AI-2E family transporter [Fusobacterium mortiferum]